MMYTRGNESDFEYWGAEGWGFSDVLPFYNQVTVPTKLTNYQSETFEVPNIRKAIHGSEGPIQASIRESEIARQFINIMNSQFGLEICEDLQDFKSVNKVSLLSCAKVNELQSKLTSPAC